MARRTNGSAAGKTTDFTPKKGDGKKIESPKSDELKAVKAGRNMGERGAFGERRRNPGDLGS